MAAGQFYFTNPEAARQAIAEMQVGAAAAENASRERIAKEQTASQRYATQSQIAERDKDRAVAREDIASRSRYGTAAVNQERGNIQFNTILGSLTAFDPPTRRELEAALANSLLSDDLKNELRAEREKAYKVAKSNFEMGDQAARNYKTLLAGKKPGDIGLDKLHQRIINDKNVIFDLASNSVESKFRAPREDGLQTGAAISPTQDYGGAALAPLPKAPPVTGVTDIEDLKRQFGRPGSTPPPASMIGPAGPPSQQRMEWMDSQLDLAPRSRSVRMADIAQPPPPMQAGPMFTVPQEFMPQAQPPAENRLLQILSKMPQFASLPPAGKQMVLDQVTGGLMSMPEPAPPRVSDFQTVRPEFVPMDDRYLAPQ